MNKLFKALVVLTSCASIAAVGGLVACSSSSDNPTPSEGILYELDSSGEYYYVLSIGTCTDSDIVIAAEYNGLPVKRVSGLSTSTNYAYITSIYVPDGVEEIGSYAFYGNIKLTEVRLPDSITYIGDYAFMSCESLTEINLTNNLTYIGKEAFWGCSALESVYLGSNVTKIGYQAFGDCTSLTSVVIPDSVTELEYLGGEFRNCTSLKSVTIGKGLTTLSLGMFAGCTSLESIVIPENITLISDMAFSGCSNLTSVTLEDSDGWRLYSYINASKNKTYSSALDSYNLDNARTVAALISDTYAEYYWEKV